MAATLSWNSRHGKRLLSLPNFASVVNPDARAVLEAGMPAWVGELLARGVVERKARQLALDIPDDQPVFDQIEYAEYLIQQDRRGRSAKSPTPLASISGLSRTTFRFRPISKPPAHAARERNKMPA